jgi:hypothetical protein
MYLVISKCVTAVKVSNFSGHYLRNRSTLDIGVLGYKFFGIVWYIGIVWPKEHSPEVRSFPPGTPCICIYDSHLWWDSPFTQHITLCFLYCFSGLWAFCLAVLLLTYVVANKIWSCLEMDQLQIILMLCFITASFLHISLMFMAALAMFQAMIWIWLA